MWLSDFVNGNVRGTIPTEFTVSLYPVSKPMKLMHVFAPSRNSPYADKFYVDVDGKCLFEFVTLVQAFIILRILFVRKRNLLVVPWRQEAYFVEPDVRIIKRR